MTPVGPGHGERARECRASIEAAWRQSRGPFSQLEFCFVDDGRGELGRSKARNSGIAAARLANADWIFFLDADDLMAPRAFEIFSRYTDDFDAVWGLIALKPPGESTHHIRFPQALTLRSLDELLVLDPFISLSMGHFERVSVAETAPFDEALDAGEDFDHYVNVWQKCRCTKVSEVLTIIRADQHSTGPRAASANQWRAAATSRLAQGMKSHALVRDSSRALMALNRISAEAQAFSRARNEATPDNLAMFAERLPYSALVDCNGCDGGDFVLYSNDDDVAALSIGWIGDYLPAATRLWQALAKSSELILDIGANSGHFTLLAARAAPAARIFSFEPRVANFARLQLNLALNDMRNVSAINLDVAADKIVSRAQDAATPVLIRMDPANVLAALPTLIDRAHPDFLIAVETAAAVERLERELRQFGYRFYAIDEIDETIVGTERLLSGTEDNGNNRWATTRRAVDATAIIEAAACRTVTR